MSTSLSIDSTINDNSIDFFVSCEEDIKLKRYYIKVNNKIKKTNKIKNGDSLITFDIVFDYDYIVGDNAVCLCVVYFDSDGNEHTEEHLCFFNKEEYSPLFNIIQYNIHNDNLIIYFNIEYDSCNYENVNVYINDVLLSKPNIIIRENNTDGNIEDNFLVNDKEFIKKYVIEIPIDMISESFCNLYFYVCSNNKNYLFVRKALFIEDNIFITDSWLYTNKIYYKTIANRCRVSYLNTGTLKCCYTTDGKIFYNVKNFTPFEVNNNWIRLMFLIIDDARLTSYKVEFNNLIL